MAPNTDFSIPVNGEIDLFAKHSKGLEISLEDPQHLSSPTSRDQELQAQDFSLEPVFKKHTQKLFLDQNNWSRFCTIFQILHIILSYHEVYNPVMTRQPVELDRAKDSLGAICLDPSWETMKL